MSALSIWMASIAATISMIAFIFDMVVWNIASSRIKSSGGTASLGQANWMVLAAFLLLAFSGCAFGFGRRVIKRRPRRDVSEQSKPKVDDSYAAESRQNATYAAWQREQNKDGGLPPFADASEEESIPLRTWDAPEENISGVGYGQRKDTPPVPTMPAANLNPGYGSYPTSQASSTPMSIPSSQPSSYQTPAGATDPYLAQEHPGLPGAYASASQYPGAYDNQGYFPSQAAAPYGQAYGYPLSPPLQPGGYMPYPERQQSPPRQVQYNNIPIPRPVDTTPYASRADPSPISPTEDSVYSQPSGLTTNLNRPLPQAPLPLPGEGGHHDNPPYDAGAYDAVPPSYSSENVLGYQPHGDGKAS
jgi:hypothetical protein